MMQTVTTAQLADAADVDIELIQSAILTGEIRPPDIDLGWIIRERSDLSSLIDSAHMARINRGIDNQVQPVRSHSRANEMKTARNTLRVLADHLGEREAVAFCRAFAGLYLEIPYPPDAPQSSQD